MTAATLDDFMALNDQLAALVAAGVPIDIDMTRRGADAAETLERINAAIARRVSQGASLANSVASEEKVAPPAYRALVHLGLKSGDFSAALGASSRVAASVDDSWHIVRLSLLYPAIVCGLAYVGFVVFCLLFVPRLEAMYSEMQILPGPGLKALRSLRGTLPYWVAVPPLAALLLAIWIGLASRRGGRRGDAAGPLAWIPGMAHALFQQRAAIFADAVRALFAAGSPIDEALSAAAGTWKSAAMRDATRSLAASLKQGQMPAGDGQLALKFPPLLRWALWHAEATTGRPAALGIAAGVYRQWAARRIQRLRMIAPLFACVVIGGSATLLYGLALFVPFVDLLQALAAPPISSP